MDLHAIQKVAEDQFAATEARIAELRERQTALKRQAAAVGNQAKRLEQELASERSFTADYIARIQREQEKTARRLQEIDAEIGEDGGEAGGFDRDDADESTGVKESAA